MAPIRVLQARILRVRCVTVGRSARSYRQGSQSNGAALGGRSVMAIDPAMPTIVLLAALPVAGYAETVGVIWLIAGALAGYSLSGSV